MKSPLNASPASCASNVAKSAMRSTRFDGAKMAKSCYIEDEMRDKTGSGPDDKITSGGLGSGTSHGGTDNPVVAKKIVDDGKLGDEDSGTSVTA